MTLFDKLTEFMRNAEDEFYLIPIDRKLELERVADYIKVKLSSGEKAKLVFICTHNSRRSHFGQIWAATAAAYYHIPSVFTYSGGTEATAFNPRSVAAVKRAGFEVIQVAHGENPLYQVQFANDASPLVLFSKKYDDDTNPKEGFCAIMTCHSADEACPVIHGADLRIAIRYEDPKAFDDTGVEAQMYDERCRQIAVESLYIFSKIKT